MVSVTTGDSAFVASIPRRPDDEDGLSVCRRRRVVVKWCKRNGKLGPDGVWLLAVECCVAYGLFAFRHEPGTRRMFLHLAESKKPSNSSAGLGIEGVSDIV